MRSVLADPNEAQLLSARIPSASFDQGRAPLSPTVTALAARLAARARPDAFARLAAIATYLTGPAFGLQPPGHSVIGSGTYQVDQLLSVTRSGSPEQFAAAFALLARAMGFPSRLVVGYTGGHAAGRGAVAYTTRDLTVWPEVELSGIGWVPFPADPAPGRAGSSSPASAPGALGAALRHQQQVNSAPPVRPSSTLSPASVPGGRSAGSDWLTVLVVMVVGVVAAAGLATGAVLLAKTRRRRRQRDSSDALQRMRGSWEFVVDRAIETGVKLPATLTRDETADRIGAVFGSSCRVPLAVLAPLVDAAVYDRRRPPASDQVEAAWQQADVFGAELQRILSPGRRLQAAMSVAPWRPTWRRRADW